MSFLNEFEGRIGSVFGAAPQGYTEPFSFKKLAKRAAREMENETYEIDGVDTAPALYTILVSASDDSLMRPLYQKITAETAAFVAAEAGKKGYAFVGDPLVRFMVDPALKSGKFAVFAENVDARTLADLRSEEQAFLGANASVGVGGAAGMRAARRPQAQKRVDGPAQRRGGAPMATPTPAPVPAAPVPAPAPTPAVSPVAAPVSGAAHVAAAVESARAVSPLPVNAQASFGDSVGLAVMPPSYDFGEPMPVASSTSSTPMPVSPAPLVTPAAAPAAIPVPATQRKSVPLVDLRRGVGANAAENVVAGVAAGANAEVAASVAAQAEAAAQVPDPLSNPDPYGVGLGGGYPAPPAATCLLIDRQTGRTFTGTAPSTVIGRERSQAGIVLRDPNVSRRHAELSFDGRDWHILDLRSTNGTLVNDVDVDECVLRDGDLLTLGLVNLEFRENH